ncbi:MAG TPA: hypothetical protein VFS76_14000 [Pyrinomonadaceae bacterium]|nr:hypothetical protein [Pyrinomonadaceae bacterium]
MGTPARLFVNASELLLIRALLECWFPNLENEVYCAESESDEDYNCIAWAAGDTSTFWWPSADPLDAFWPIAWREESKECFIEAFGHIRQNDNYEVCDPPDFDFEPGFEKVALYLDAQDKPQHMARQLASGIWTSKLGKSWDILHQTEKGVEGARYGSAVIVMRRPIQ